MRTLLVNMLRWAAVAAPIMQADAAFLTVNNTNPNCHDTGTPIAGVTIFCTIQAALNVAPPDSEVTVQGNVYNESPRIRTDNLSLTGGGNNIEAPKPTIIGVRIEAINVLVQNFIVEGGGITATTLPGSSNCANVIIVRNIVNNSDVILDHCSNPEISDNIVNGGGISMSFSGGQSFFIDGNTVSGNGGSGFTLFMSRGATLVRNIARNNAGDGFLLDASEAVLKRNKAIGNGENGFEIGLVSFGDLTRNRAIGNRFFGIREIKRFVGDPAGGNGTYKKNICRRNRLGASSPRGLCKRK